MAIVHLHVKSHVGTTYKRALKRFHHLRDGVVPAEFRPLSLIGRSDNWFVLISN